MLCMLHTELSSQSMRTLSLVSVAIYVVYLSFSGLHYVLLITVRLRLTSGKDSLILLLCLLTHYTKMVFLRLDALPTVSK